MTTVQFLLRATRMHRWSVWRVSRSRRLAQRSRNSRKESTATIRHLEAQQFNNAHTSAYQALASLSLMSNTPSSLSPESISWMDPTLGPNMHHHQHLDGSHFAVRGSKNQDEEAKVALGGQSIVISLYTTVSPPRVDIVSNTSILARKGEKRVRVYECLFSIRRKGLPHARAVTRDSRLMSMVFTAILECVDMGLL